MVNNGCKDQRFGEILPRFFPISAVIAGVPESRAIKVNSF